MELNKLQQVAEGILDTSAAEYFEQNTKDYYAVQDYAENGLDITLTDDEAEKVREVLVAYDSNEELHGSGNNYYHHVIKALEN